MADVLIGYIRYRDLSVRNRVLTSRLRFVKSYSFYCLSKGLVIHDFVIIKVFVSFLANLNNLSVPLFHLNLNKGRFLPIDHFYQLIG